MVTLRTVHLPAALVAAACTGEISLAPDDANSLAAVDAAGDAGDRRPDPQLGSIPNAYATACLSTSNRPPEAPAVVSPGERRKDVVAGTVLASTPYRDPDGDVHAASQFEVWRLSMGVPIERVWSATTSDPAKLVRVTLADGVYEGSAAAQGALAAWKDHVLRVRHRDGRATCPAWSAWSEDRAFRTDDGSSFVFDEDVIRDYYLEIPDSSWARIDAEALPPGCQQYSRNYYEGTLHFDGQTFEGVGVRIKGGCGSSRRLSGKPSFKVNLSWNDPAVPGCPTERRAHGVEHFQLHNGVQDSTFEHERLGYKVYAAMGLPVPRTAHARLFVKKGSWTDYQLYGLYLVVETIDRRFLDRWFDSNRGMMYEGAYWCDLTADDVPQVDNPPYSCFQQEFSTDECDVPEPGDDPTDWMLLRQLANQLATPGDFYPAVQTYFEFDRFLASWAVDSMLLHWDGYPFHIMNNYRVYHDPSTGRWTMVETGIDQTFRERSGARPFDDVRGVLALRCLAEADCKAAFAAKLRQAADVFQALDLPAKALAIYLQTQAAYDADPRTSFTSAQRLSDHNTMINWINARPDAIRAVLAAKGY